MLAIELRGRIICAPEFLEIKEVLGGQMEGQGAEAIQLLTALLSIVFICGGQKKERLVPHRRVGGRLPAEWKSASTVRQNVYIETARAHCQVQEMTAIMPNVASVSSVGDGFGM